MALPSTFGVFRAAMKLLSLLLLAFSIVPVPILLAQQYCASGTVTSSTDSSLRGGDPVEVMATIQPNTVSCSNPDQPPRCNGEALLQIQIGSRHWTSSDPRNSRVGFISNSGTNVTFLLFGGSAFSTLPPSPNAPAREASFGFAIKFPGILPRSFPVHLPTPAQTLPGNVPYFRLGGAKVSYTGQDCPGAAPSGSSSHLQSVPDYRVPGHSTESQASERCPATNAASQTSENLYDLTGRMGATDACVTLQIIDEVNRTTFNNTADKATVLTSLGTLYKQQLAAALLSQSTDGTGMGDPVLGWRPIGPEVDSPQTLAFRKFLKQGGGANINMVVSHLNRVRADINHTENHDGWGVGEEVGNAMEVDSYAKIVSDSIDQAFSKLQNSTTPVPQMNPPSGKGEEVIATLNRIDPNGTSGQLFKALEELESDPLAKDVGLRIQENNEKSAAIGVFHEEVAERLTLALQNNKDQGDYDDLIAKAGFKAGTDANPGPDAPVINYFHQALTNAQSSTQTLNPALLPSVREILNRIERSGISEVQPLSTPSETQKEMASALGKSQQQGRAG